MSWPWRIHQAFKQGGMQMQQLKEVACKAKLSRQTLRPLRCEMLQEPAGGLAQ